MWLKCYKAFLSHIINFERVSVMGLEQHMGE